MKKITIKTTKLKILSMPTFTSCHIFKHSFLLGDKNE